MTCVPNAHPHSTPTLPLRLRASWASRRGRSFGELAMCECDRCVGASKPWGRGHFCDKHYRFNQMRCSARTYRKVVPSWECLESLFLSLVDMACPHCHRKMNWRQHDGADTVVSLQHWNDGRISLICHSCNVRHSRVGDEVFLKLTRDTKPCVRCKEILPLKAFSRSGSQGYARRHNICKDCCNTRRRLIYPYKKRSYADVRAAVKNC